MSIVRSRSTQLLAVVLALVLVMFSTSAMWRADALPGPSESTTVSVNPERILDTRDPTNLGLPGPFVSPTAQKLQVTGTVPTATGSKTVVPTGATGVLLNVTSVGSTADGFISIRPGDATGAPTTSSLNFLAGVTTPNAVQVTMPTTGSNAGQIDITYDALGIAGPTTDILIDVVGYTTDTGLQDINTQLGQKANSSDVYTKAEVDTAVGSKVSGGLLGTSPVRVTATEAAGIVAARTAAPETMLWQNDTLEIYAKCLRNNVAGIMQAEIYVRTTTDGAMMAGAISYPGTVSGDQFLNVATPESQRLLDIQALGTADRARYDRADGAITAANGAMYQTATSIGVKQGSPAGGNGPFGAGNVCMFHGAVLG